METNYRLYAYTGEAGQRALGEQAGGEGRKKRKEAGGTASFWSRTLVTWWFTELSEAWGSLDVGTLLILSSYLLVRVGAADRPHCPFL